MEVKKKIETYQEYYGTKIHFEPDSSPEAWKYYINIYSSNKYLNEKYNFQKLVFYRYDKERRDNFKYANEPNETGKNNRLFILLKGTKTKTENGIERFSPGCRLGGECDFNFNAKKCVLFENIINGDASATVCDKENARGRLENCRKNHHTLLNFSLMQSVGDLQGVKGSNRFDRFDTFISNLNKYYLGISDLVLQSATSYNKPMLKSFLNDFKDIYEYCSIFYQLNDREFIDRIIKDGAMPISNISELTRYMTLAEEYWSIKDNLINDKT